MGTKTGELRETLIATIDDLRSGKITPDKATAIAKLASAITASLQIEINAAKELRAMGVKSLPETGSLGLGETVKHLSAVA